MCSMSKRETVCFDEEIHKALRLKAEHTQRSFSDLVNEAVRITLIEDQEDIDSIEERSHESVISYEEFLEQLKDDGKI